MKRYVLILLGLLLCFAVFVLPAAAEDATEQTVVDSGETETAWFNRSPYTNYRKRYTRRDRAYYANDPRITIQDHIVYLLVRDCDAKGRPSGDPFYAIIDFFDSDATEETATRLRIPSEVNGIPVLEIYLRYYDSMLYDIPQSVGYGNDTVTSVVIDEGMTRLDPFAFSGFTALKKITLPSSLTELCWGAFQNCKALKKIVAKGDLTRIGDYAFYGCKQLNFPVPQTLQSIGSQAYSASGIEKAVFPATVSFLSDSWYYGDYTAGTFSDCKKLKTLRVTERVEQPNGYALPEGFCRGCTALETVAFPKEGERIFVSRSAFADCSSLHKIVNLERVVKISDCAFENCTGLRELTIPKETDFIHETAFSGCRNLRSITLETQDTSFLSDRYGWIEWGANNGHARERYSESGNFVKCLPKACAIYVTSEKMKLAVCAHGFKGTVVLRVPVSAPKNVKATKQNGKVTVKWSKVKVCDGYRVWAYNEKTGKYQKLATVKAGVTSVTVKSNAKKFAVRAYINEAGEVSWSKLKTCTVS